MVTKKSFLKLNDHHVCIFTSLITCNQLNNYLADPSPSCKSTRVQLSTVTDTFLYFIPFHTPLKMEMEMESKSPVEGEDFVKETFLSKFLNHPRLVWNKKSIYRVPCFIRDHNYKAYQPRVVSIGPYHSGNHQLEPMEEHKYRALRHYRSRAYNISVEDLVAHFQNDDDFMDKVMDSYSKPIDPQWWDSSASSLLMVLDGSFLLELFLSSTSEHNCGSGDSPAMQWCYSADDPIFGACQERMRSGIVSYVKLDMLLVENQIPLIILEKLSSIAGLNVNLNGLIRSFYGFQHEEDACMLTEALGLHVLDVYRKACLFPGEYSYSGWTSSKSARELEDHGVRFSRSSSTVGCRNGRFNDVGFKKGRKRNIILLSPLLSRDAKFTLPSLTIDETTEQILFNLMAFERLHLGKEGRGMGVTNYVFLMSSLVRSEEDVRSLRKSSVVSNSPEGSDTAVVNLFAKLTRNVMVDDGRGVGRVNNEIREVCERKLNRFRASFVHNFASDLRVQVYMMLVALLILNSIVNTVVNLLTYIRY